MGTVLHPRRNRPDPLRLAVLLDPCFDFIEVATDYLTEQGYREESVRQFLDETRGQVGDAALSTLRTPPKLEHLLGRFECDDETVRALDWPEETGRDPPQVTGGWQAADYVDAYRLYYANEKRHLFSWAKERDPPPWLDEYAMPDGSDGHPY